MCTTTRSTVSIHARHCCRANRSERSPCQLPELFQSTPGIAAGRIRASCSPASIPACFNPRPALLPGESCRGAGDKGGGHVSIHARHCCRANPFGLLCYPLQQAVSIHARHCCRANRAVVWASATVLRFQSTPGIAAGRITLPDARLMAAVLFQSTPGIAAGRIVQAVMQRPATRAVSIHARHCCRANRSVIFSSNTKNKFQSTPGIAAGRIPHRRHGFLPFRLFQSTPGIAAGRILLLAFDGPAMLVSIHARHCCRANHALFRTIDTISEVSIHARHCCRANPTPPPRHRSANAFQSTPGIAAGRIHRRPGARNPDHRFNPRPALLPGESQRSTLDVGRVKRFNPRPALLPGESAQQNRIPEARQVSIHARHCCRANLSPCNRLQRWRQFQSTPGIAAGRIAEVAVQMVQFGVFQSTPGIAAGRILRIGRWAA